MADITMCLGTNCPYKETCYRFTATPNEYRQAYFMEPPIKDGECEHYWGDAEVIWSKPKEIVK